MPQTPSLGLVGARGLQMAQQALRQIREDALRDELIKRQQAQEQFKNELALREQTERERATGALESLRTREFEHKAPLETAESQNRTRLTEAQVNELIGRPAERERDRTHDKTLFDLKRSADIASDQQQQLFRLDLAAKGDKSALDQIAARGTQERLTNRETPRPLVPIVVQGPQGPVIVDRASGTSRDVTAPGGGQLGRPVNQVTAEKVAGMEQSLAVLDDLEQLRNDEWLGPIAGRAMEMSLNIPGIAVNEKFAKFSAQTSTLKNGIVKAITGAQMSEPEAKRIMGQVPSLTDKPEVWIQKAAATRENLSLLRERTMQLTGASRGMQDAGSSESQTLGPGERMHSNGINVVKQGPDGKWIVVR